MVVGKIMPAAFCLAAVSQPASAAPLQTAVLAGGCFWGVESVYEHVKGVREVVSGYAGGHGAGLTRSQSDEDPAEAVRIRFDPAQISYDQLLHIFFEVAHDPTQLNRQGPDIGVRYRSAIFPQNADQRAISEQFLAKLRPQRVVTWLESGGFEVAEADQQDFVKKHPNLPYVLVNDVPKLAELRSKYPQFWRD
jgi:peptide-methionine (S)-S-oxide reductase